MVARHHGMGPSTVSHVTDEKPRSPDGDFGGIDARRQNKTGFVFFSIRRRGSSEDFFEIVCVRSTHTDDPRTKTKAATAVRTFRRDFAGVGGWDRATGRSAPTKPQGRRRT